MPHLPSLPPAASLLDVYQLDMDLAQPLIRYQQQLMRGPSPLSVGERELIAAYVSGLNACRFCVGVHTEVAGRFGMEAALVETLLEEGPSPESIGKLAPILSYVRKLTEEPARVVAADSGPVFAAGWDETACCTPSRSVGSSTSSIGWSRAWESIPIGWTSRNSPKG